MGLSARYKRRAIRTTSGCWMKIDGKLKYAITYLYTSCSGKTSYDFYWKFK